MAKKGLLLLIMHLINHLILVKRKKALGIMKPKLGGVIMKELIKLQTKCIHT